MCEFQVSSCSWSILQIQGRSWAAEVMCFYVSWQGNFQVEACCWANGWSKWFDGRCELGYKATQYTVSTEVPQSPHAFHHL